MIRQPQPDEYAPFYANYVRLAGTDYIIQTLTQLQDSTLDFFMALPPHKADYAYAEGKWTVKQVIGHLIDAERTFAYRTLCFSRCQPTILPGFDENEYVANANFNERELVDLVQEFKIVREANLYLFRSITEDQSLQMGEANGKTISVRALLYVTAGHELHHLHILKERYL